MYTKNRLANIAGSNFYTFGKYLEHEKFAGDVDALMYALLNRVTDLPCLWCGKHIKIKGLDLDGKREVCSENCRLHVVRFRIAMGEFEPAGCNNCPVCKKDYPVYKELSASLAQVTCGDPACHNERRHPHNIPWNGKMWRKCELAEELGVTQPTFEKRLKLMNGDYDRVMSDEPTPYKRPKCVTHGLPTEKKVDPKNTVLARDRNTKCRKTNFDSGKRETCVKYGDCWNEDDKVICSGLEIGNIVDGVPQLGNVGTVITRGCGDFGAIKGI